MKTAVLVSLVAWASVRCAGAAHPATEEFVRDLRSSIAAVRRHAAASLGRAGGATAPPALVEALRDPDKGVRREAAKALGLIKAPVAATPLVEALRDDDANVRACAAYALGEIQDPKAADALLGALRDPEWCVRDQAAWALREIRDPKIIAPLVAALREPDADAAHVLWTLRRAGGQQAIAPLAALLDDPAVETRMRALRALAEIRDGDTVPPLLAALKDSDPGIRRRAVEELSGIEDDRVDKPLLDLAAREQHPSVREALAKAVQRLICRGGLAAYWSFDDRNAQVATDVTGRGVDGEIKGCAPVEGKVGAALQFSKGKYVELGRPKGLPIGGRPLTFMAWVKSDAPNGVVIARGGAFCGFSLYIKDGAPRFGIHRVKEGPAYIAAGREDVVGSWVHLAGVVKEDRVEVYVNGKLAGTTKTEGYIPGDCGQGMEIGFDTANSPAEITDNFEGVIDEVKAYHAALSAEDIAKHCRPE